MNSIDIEKEVKEILKKLPSECAFIDYKEKVYEVEKKYSFVKDVIAMLNSLESIGEDKYIIFGVSDEKKLYGIEDDLLIRNATFQNWSEQYIYPIPHIDTGTVLLDNKKFGYICISKDNINDIYEVREDFIITSQDKLQRKKVIFKQQVFCRRGSKNAVIKDEERENFISNRNFIFYQKKIKEKIPNLKLGFKLLGSINDNEENKSEWNEYNFSKNIKIKGKNLQPYDYIFKKAHNYNEFLEEFKKYVTNEYIDNYYNRVIIEKSDEIDKYNRDCLLYSSIFENGQIFNLFVENEGIAKALDIKIIIEFPKDILVKFTDEAKNTPEPIKPDIPKSPLDKLNEERYKELYFKSILDSVNDSPKNFIVKIEDHKIDITIEKLLYMDSEEIDNICIIPTKTGKFDVKVSIICEEYLKPQEYTITFEVEDK